MTYTFLVSTLSIGMRVFVLDIWRKRQWPARLSKSQWRASTITSIDAARNRVGVHFLGWADLSAECELNLNDDIERRRIARLATVMQPRQVRVEIYCDVVPRANGECRQAGAVLTDPSGAHRGNLLSDAQIQDDDEQSERQKQQQQSAKGSQ
jgi:hypothetical protein